MKMKEKLFFVVMKWVSKMESKSVSMVCFLGVLVFVMVFVGCATTGSANLGTSPELTGFIVLTSKNAIPGNWVPQTNFTVEEGRGINIGIRGTDEEGDANKITLILKQNGVAIDRFEGTFTLRKIFTQFWGSFSIPEGEYTGEVYVTDKKNNNSNILTVNFTVR